MSSYVKDKEQIILRLRKMEGQLKGIQKMVEENSYCVDVLNQLYSVIAATQKVAQIILKDHIQGCVRDAITQNDHSHDHVNELMTVVQRYMRK